MRKYIQFFKPGKRRAVIIISSKLIKASSELTGDVSAEADDYYHESEAMDDDGIIACADLKREAVNGRRVYYPYGTFVHPSFRNEGFGIELYKACLMCIEHKMEMFKSKQKPLFVQHCIADPLDGSTSDGAKKVYNSLVKRGYLMKIADGTYKIRKFPKLKYKIIE